MKIFSILFLFPCGFYSGNVALAECRAKNEAEAIKIFQSAFPDLQLNERGYAQRGIYSYTVGVNYF